MGTFTTSMDLEMDELERLILNDPFELRDEKEIRKEWEKLEKKYAEETFDPDRDLEELEYLISNPGSTLMDKNLEKVNEMNLYVFEAENIRKMKRNEAIGVDEVETTIEEKWTVPPKKEDLGELLIPLVIDDTTIMALVDTGASANYMPEALFDTLYFMPEIAKSKIRIKLADQSYRYPLGQVEDVRVEVAGLLFHADFIITTSPIEMKHPIIIGRTFLNTARAVVDLEKQATILKRWNRNLVFAMKKKENDKPDDNTIHMMGKTPTEIVDMIGLRRSEIEFEEKTDFDDLNEPEFEVFNFQEISGSLFMINDASNESKKQEITNTKSQENDEVLGIKETSEINVDGWGVERWRNKELEELGNCLNTLELGDDMGIFDDAPSSDEDDDEDSWIIFKPNAPPIELPIKQAIEELMRDSSKGERESEVDDWGDGNSGIDKEVTRPNRPSIQINFGDVDAFALPCQIKNEHFQGLVDTGASVNVMPFTIYERFNLPNFKEHNMIMELANNSTTTTAGKVENVTVKIKDFEYMSEFVLVHMAENPIHQIIVGRPLLKIARALIDFDDDSVMIKSGCRAIMFGLGNPLNNLFRAYVFGLNGMYDFDKRKKRHGGITRRLKNKKGKFLFLGGN